jgi:hypothetical protein
MWFMQNYRHKKGAFYKKRTTFFIDKEFQLRYIFTLVGAALIGMIVSSLPILYYATQNYDIFKELAFSYEPKLISHLSREITWIKFLLATSTICLTGFFTYFGYKVSNKIVAPIKILNYHIKFLSRGKWHLNPIKIRSNDEFQELIDNYNYFFTSFKTQINMEMRKLKNINKSDSEAEKNLEINEMLTDKQRQLGHLLSEPDERVFNLTSLRAEETEPSRVKHHAS